MKVVIRTNDGVEYEGDVKFMGSFVKIDYTKKNELKLIESRSWWGGYKGEWVWNTKDSKGKIILPSQKILWIELVR